MPTASYSAAATPGATGPKGDRGDTGSQGQQGAVGAQGTAGATGATGTAGSQGSQGPKGDTGSTGATGPQGNAGAQGTAGTAGATGATGSTGAAGASFNVQAPVAGNAITMGTALQPRSGGPCCVVVTAVLSGVVGLNELITVAMSSTSGGTYTTVGTGRLGIALLGIVDEREIASFLVPTGYWLKVTRSGSAASATYTRIDL